MTGERGAIRWRAVLALAILAGLTAMVVRLAPPYIQNWKFQRYLNSMAEEPANSAKEVAVMEAQVIGKALSLNIPLKVSDLEVEREDSRVHIKALYVVRVDLPGYTVDLHFRPEAGGA